MTRKINAMYAHYGRDLGGHTCGECVNFYKSRPGEFCDRSLQKCRAYGLTHSEATDWAQKWDACGRFGKLIDEKREMPLFFVISRGAKGAAEQVDGQIEL